MARYVDLDKVEFLKVDNNKEFNHGVDCCINKLLEIEPADVIERENVKRLIEAAIEDSWELDYVLERLKEI